MFTRAGIRALHAWTHECLDLLIDHAGAMPVEAFTRELEGFARPSVRDQLVHVLACEAAWVSGLRGTAIRRLTSAEYPTPASLVPAKRSVMADTLDYVASLDEARLSHTIENPPPEWIGPPRSPAFILHHVLTHAFHHKGQIVAMFRILGYPAPDTDLQR